MTLLRKNTETCRPCSARIQRHVDLAPQKNGDIVLELKNGGNWFLGTEKYIERLLKCFISPNFDPIIPFLTTFLVEGGYL